MIRRPPRSTLFPYTTLPDLELPDAVHGRHCSYGVVRSDLLRHPAHLLDGARVSRIAQAYDRTAGVLVAHGPHEQGYPARAGIADGGKHLVDGERALPDREQPDRIHCASPSLAPPLACLADQRRGAHHGHRGT